MPSLAPTLQSLQEELLVVMAAMARIQEHYNQVAQQAVEHTQQLQTRVDELESEKLATASQLVSLQVQNAELERLMEIKQPETWKAIDARNAALRKLKHTRGILRDLLDERGVGSGIGCLGTQLGASGVSTTSGEHSWDEMDGSSSSSSDSDDETTVRPRARTDTATETDVSSPPMTIVEGVEPEMDMRTAHIALGLQDDPEMASVDEPSKKTHAPRLDHTQDLDSTAKEDEWYVEYLNAPATSEVRLGPWSYNELAELLRLGDETTVCIGSLEWMQDPCLRLHVHNDMVFLVDPIVLEGPSVTYLISWGTTQVNNNIRRYITQGRPNKPSFHMLVSPAGKNDWWYLGLQSWNPTTCEPIWPKLSSKQQKKLSTELQRRWNSALSSQEIADRIEEGELGQFCVELSGGRVAECTAFARDSLKLEEVDDS